MTKTLDINTPRGQQAFADQLRAMEIVFREAEPGHQFIHTGGDEAARVDGMIVRHGYIHSVAEVKSRDMTLAQLRGPFRNEWLITKAKLDDLSHASRLFNANGYGFLFCVPDKVVLAVRLCDKTGRIVCQHRIERTETQATCNGGTANRLNAFVKMTHAKPYQG